MTDTAARAYNERQKYNPKFIRLCRETLGLCPGDAWRDDDAEVIAAWQAENKDPSTARKLDVDGKVGPATASAIREASGVMLRPERFVWWDSGPRERIGVFKRFGFRRIAFMVNRIEDKREGVPAWKYTRDERLTSLTDYAAARDIKRTLTAWVRPNPAQLDAVLAYWDHMIPLTGAESIEAELEGNWTRGNVRGFASLEEAGAYLARGMMAIKKSHGVRLIGTTLPWHDELDPEKATVSPALDALSVQWYSRAKMERLEDGSRRIKPWYAYDGPQGPGTWQHRGIPAARAVGPEIICGLAGYTQQFPGRRRFDAMECALTAASLEGVQEVGWWSSKHCLPGSVMADFLGALGDAS